MYQILLFAKSVIQLNCNYFLFKENVFFLNKTYFVKKPIVVQR